MSNASLKKAILVFSNIHTCVSLVYIISLWVLKDTWFFTNAYLELYLVCFAVPTIIIFPVSYYIFKGFYYGGVFVRGRRARNEIYGLLFLNVFFIYCLI